MRQRHKDPEYKEKDFVHMALRVPAELHADLIREQETRHMTGKPINLKDLTISIINEWSKNKKI